MAERGLHVVVYPSGAKVWRFRYHLDGKRRHVRVGEYPAMDADQARKRSAEFRDQVKEGIDPTESLRLLKVARAEERRRRVSLTDLVSQYVAECKRSGMKSFGEREATLERHFVTPWGASLAIQEITRERVKSRLADIGSKHPVASNRAHSYLRAMLNYAVTEGLLADNPAAKIKQYKELRKRRSLTAEELKQFWKDIGTCPGIRAVQIALQLVLLTGQRPGEVIGMDVRGLNADWWQIPGSATKNGVDQRVYLTETAQRLIDEALTLSRSKKYVFARSPKQPMDLHKLSAATRLWAELKESQLEPFTPHDCRRTMATNLGRLGVSRFVQSRILNHTDDSITGGYDVHDYDEVKKDAWVLWEAELLRVGSVNCE